jgi:Protein of unknown function (DUF3106)
MSWLRQFIFACAVGAVFHLQAETLPDFPGLTDTNLMPPMPKLSSPVIFFRQLLAMTAIERNHSLANRTPEARAKIFAKIREYQALDPDKRELRLRATELRWYLTPLLRLPTDERKARLAQVPDELRGLIESRLKQWDILPPPLQAEFLASDQALHYFARVEDTNQVAITLAQEKIGKQFNQFFELTPVEKEQTLKNLSTAERAQMEKTLRTFETLPLQQRLICLRNYAKFAGMSAAERAEFLKNAERWSQMSPAERQTWRDLVAHVPLWPPLPPVTVPPGLIPPAPPKISRMSVATNLN